VVDIGRIVFELWLVAFICKPSFIVVAETEFDLLGDFFAAVFA